MKNLKISTISSLVVIIIAIGTIFYHAMIVKRDVDHLNIEYGKQENKIIKNNGKINNNEKEIKILQSEIEFIKNKEAEYNNQITSINDRIIDMSKETQHKLIEVIEKVSGKQCK